jgi:hypothetical protein
MSDHDYEGFKSFHLHGFKLFYNFSTCKSFHDLHVLKTLTQLKKIYCLQRLSLSCLDCLKLDSKSDKIMAGMPGKAK